MPDNQPSVLIFGGGHISKSVAAILYLAPGSRFTDERYRLLLQLGQMESS
jgi:hypothetical protein